jgi:phage baseplate assembly protein gpV
LTEGLVETTAQADAPDDRNIFGVTVAMVIDNVDVEGEAQVQLRLPWLPGIEPWAKVASPNKGFFFIPQIGDEVLVAFNQGDIREPYIIGSLWSTLARPPAPLPTDSINKFVINTPLGHKIEFDDVLQTITISTITQQKVTIDPASVKLSTTGDMASVMLDVAGNVSIQAKTKIELNAPMVIVNGIAAVDIKSSTCTSITGGATCAIQAGVVKIN